MGDQPAKWRPGKRDLARFVAIMGGLVLFGLLAPQGVLDLLTGDVPGLGDQVRVSVDDCEQQQVSGRVKNQNDSRVDVFIDVRLETTDGLLVDSVMALVRNVGPDQTALWDVRVSAPRTFQRCIASVGTVVDSG